MARLDTFHVFDVAWEPACLQFGLWFVFSVAWEPKCLRHGANGVARALETSFEPPSSHKIPHQRYALRKGSDAGLSSKKD